MEKLPINTDIILYDYNDRAMVFNIKKVIGVGGTCLAYIVEYHETNDITHIGVLKEFCPAYLGEDCRSENGSLIVPETMRDRFDCELANFKDVYKTINEYLSANMSAANYHAVQIGLFTGNNTAYTLSACDYGKSYDKISDDSLHGLIKIALATTKAVEMYHNAGFLHLDIKPKNILILDDVFDLVKLFDFDSLTSIDSIRNRTITAVPVPEDYYVPELVNADIRNIGITTDIFEIGAMIFLRLFGRAPSSKEREHNFIYDFDEVKLLDGVSPAVKFEIEVLLMNTVQTAKSRRYSTIAELKKQLEKILELCDTKKPYIINMPKWQQSAHAMGRETELKTIKSLLDTYGYVFIQGMGGIGKSELAKMYAEKYAQEYHTVQFCKYSDSLKMLVAALPINGIDEDEYHDFDKLVRDKNRILHTADSHTLIIVDNFNVGFDEYLREFLPAENGFKVIFTTRCLPASDYHTEKTLKLATLPKELCLRLFYNSVGSDRFENADDLLDIVECNTLAVVLLASAVRKTGKDIQEIANKIKEQTIDEIDDILFYEYDYEGKAYNKLLSHLFAIFNISALSQSEAEMLKNMTLIPNCGISLNELVSECGFAQADQMVIESLCDSSWLYSDNNIISMHPMVSDLIAWNDSVEINDSYRKLADSLESYCVPDGDSHISVVMRQLAFALQLERRYKTESAEKRIMIAEILGNIHMDIYDPAKASDYFYGAEKTALNEKTGRQLPEIYYFIANYEMNFGTPEAAVEYYKKSIHLGNNIRIRDYSSVLNSMCGLGECYHDNKNAKEAFAILKKAIRFARIHKFTDYYADIYDLLAEICEALNLHREAEQYLRQAAKYRDETEVKKDISEFAFIADDIERADFRELRQSFEKYLIGAAEQYGEDSPMYKDIARNRWFLYITSGDTQTGIRQLNESISFVASTYGHNSLEMVWLLSSACELLPLVNEYEAAFGYIKKALSICEKNKSQSYIKQKAYLSAAKLYALVGDIETAKQYLAYIDLDQYTNKEVLTDSLHSLGPLLLETGEYDKLNVLSQKVLALHNTGVIDRFMAITFSAFVDIYRGNIEKARKKLEQAEQLRLKNNNFISDAINVLYLRLSAQISYKCGKYNEAVKTISVAVSENRQKYLLPVLLAERGLYYSFSGDFGKSQEDYDTVIKVYQEQKMPVTAYTMLFSNIATNYYNAGNYLMAKEYADKIISVNPDILSEKSLNAAVVCSNIGYIESLQENGDLNFAEKMLKRSVAIFDELKADRSINYCAVKNNLALVYIMRENYKKAEVICNSILNKRDVYFSGYSGELYEYVLNNYILALLNSDPEKAEKTVLREMPLYEQYCGENKEMYLAWLGKTGGLCRYYDNAVCNTLFHRGEEYAEVNNLEGTRAYALLLNYIGAYVGTYGEYRTAIAYLERSVQLFERLGDTDSPEYQLTAENLTEIREKNTDSLIADLAKTIMEENKNE